MNRYAFAIWLFKTIYTAAGCAVVMVAVRCIWGLPFADKKKRDDIWRTR